MPHDPNLTRPTPSFKNEVHLCGTLLKDPAIKLTPTGKVVANVVLLTKSGQYTEFHNVVFWEALAARVEKLRKGDWVRVCGRLQTRSWEDKQTGQKKFTTEIIAWQLVIPSEEPAPITPDTARGGTAAARAVLAPPIDQAHNPKTNSFVNAHGVEVSDADVDF